MEPKNFTFNRDNRNNESMVHWRFPKDLEKNDIGFGHRKQKLPWQRANFWRFGKKLVNECPIYFSIGFFELCEFEGGWSRRVPRWTKQFNCCYARQRFRKCWNQRSNSWRWFLKIFFNSLKIFWREFVWRMTSNLAKVKAA